VRVGQRQGNDFQKFVEQIFDLRLKDGQVKRTAVGGSFVYFSMP